MATMMVSHRNVKVNTRAYVRFLQRVVDQNHGVVTPELFEKLPSLFQKQFGIGIQQSALQKLLRRLHRPPSAVDDNIRKFILVQAVKGCFRPSTFNYLSRLCSDRFEGAFVRPREVNRVLAEFVRAGQQELKNSKHFTK